MKLNPRIKKLFQQTSNEMRRKEKQKIMSHMTK